MERQNSCLVTEEQRKNKKIKKAKWKRLHNENISKEAMRKKTKDVNFGVIFSHYFPKQTNTKARKITVLKKQRLTNRRGNVGLKNLSFFKPFEAVSSNPYGAQRAFSWEKRPWVEHFIFVFFSVLFFFFTYLPIWFSNIWFQNIEKDLFVSNEWSKNFVLKKKKETVECCCTPQASIL